MLTKLLRSFLSVAENPRSIPNFIGVYFLLWLIWHNQFLFSFGTATGGMAERFSLATETNGELQFLSVFFVTLLLFVLYTCFQFFIKYSREHVDKMDREENSPLGELEKNADMEQLVLMLETLQQELKVSKGNESKAKTEVKNIMAKLIEVQTTLDETTADFEILKSTLKQQACS